MKILLTLLLAIIFLVPAKAQAESWPVAFRDQTNRNSILQEPIPPYESISSRNTLGSVPVTQGNLAVLTEPSLFGNVVTAYQLPEVTKRWQLLIGTRKPLQPTIYRGIVYFGVTNPSELYAVNLLSGQVLWHSPLPNETQVIRFWPVIVGDSVFVVASGLYRFTTTGQWQWKKSFQIDSPIAADETSLYLRLHNQLIVQVEPINGQTIWQYFTSTTAGTQPLVTATAIYSGTFQKIVSIDKLTGRGRWVYDTGPNRPRIGSIGAVGHLIIYSTSYGDVSALTESGTVAWTNRIDNTGSGRAPAFVIMGDKIIAQKSTTQQTSIDANNGQEISLFTATSNGSSLVSVANEYLFALAGTQLTILRGTDVTAGTLGNPPITNTPNPVVIIPGFMESWLVGGQWQIDPITKSFDGLLNGLRQAGYIDNETLFLFPYDWHLNNSVVAQQLSDRVDSILKHSSAKQVDIVSHSMGGLIASSYITSQSYAGTVAKTAFLATPHRGSLKAYLAWEGAETGPTLFDRLTKILLYYESFVAGYGDETLAYLQRNIPAVSQLLPTFNYLERDSQVLSYSPCSNAYYPCNSYIEQLNQQQSLLASRTDILNIIGSQSTKATYQRFIVNRTNEPGKWLHGKPLNYPSPNGIVNGTGDGTVLTESAHLDGVDEIVYPATHSGIISLATPAIIRWLRQADISQPSYKEPEQLTVIRLEGKANLLITNQQGQSIGYHPMSGQPVNTIPNAYISKSEEGSYIILSNPPETYKIELGSEADGNYRLIVDQLSDQLNNEQSKTGWLGKDHQANYSLSIQASTFDLSTQQSCIILP